MREMALSHNINIIGGSHPTRAADGDIHNVAYVFLRDGTVPNLRDRRFDLYRILWEDEAK